MSRPATVVSSRRRPKSARANRAGSRRFPLINRGLDIAHNAKRPLQPANEIVLVVVGGNEFSHGFTPLGDHQRLARRAYIFHESETARLELSCWNLLHGQIITYMVILR